MYLRKFAVEYCQGNYHSFSWEMRNLKVKNVDNLNTMLGVKLPPNAAKIPYTLLSLQEEHKDDSFFSNNSAAVYAKYGREIDHIA